MVADGHDHSVAEAVNDRSYAETFLVVAEPTPASLLSAPRLARLAATQRSPRVVVVANKVRGQHDAERVAQRTGLPCVGAVPYDPGVEDADRAGRAVLDCDPDGAMATAVRSLVPGPQHRDGARVKIAVVGKGGSGKTTTSAVLARTCARSGRRTLALDCDSDPNLGISLGLLGQLSRPDQVVIADFEAGLGTILRLEGHPVDVVVVVVEPSAKSLDVGRRAADSVREADLAGWWLPQTVRDLDDAARVRAAFPYLEPVLVPEDSAIVNAEREGTAPLDAAADAPAIRALVGLANDVVNTG